MKKRLVIALLGFGIVANAQMDKRAMLSKYEKKYAIVLQEGLVFGVCPKGYDSGAAGGLEALMNHAVYSSTHVTDYSVGVTESLGGHLKSGQWWSPENRPMRKQSGQAIVLLCRAGFGKVEFEFAKVGEAEPSRGEASERHWEREAQRGMHKGAAAPLVGGAAARDVPAVFAGAARVAAWGEPVRPGLPPEGETGKGEIKFLVAAG